MLFLLLLLTSLSSLSLTTLHRNRYNFNLFSNSDSSNNSDDSNNISKWFNEELKEGTTHIKYNKYAPNSEEAKNMTSVEFRKVIFDKMMAAEQQRRKEGVVGNANSDAYLNALEGKNAAGATKKSFNPFKK